jgi:DNA-binding TFAR19-related protein (PDSD5 family)
MTSSEHPAPEVLERFVLGRLDRRTMATVEAHLRSCSRCGQIATQVPDDRLVRLLRSPISGPATKPSRCNSADLP